MKLVIFNGSPRGKLGNTAKLLRELAAGFAETAGNATEHVFLRDEKDISATAQAFARCDAAILAFPLYTDAMPAVVKEFIEALAPMCGRPGLPALGFVVVSGFPEAIHCQALKRYLTKLPARMGCRFLGVVTKGNSEGVRDAGDKQNANLFAAFRRFGRDLAAELPFDEASAAKIAGPERFPKWMVAVFRAINGLGLANIPWDNTLRRNGAFQRRFDRPYPQPPAETSNFHSSYHRSRKE